jgi:hypothetical protein
MQTPHILVRWWRILCHRWPFHISVYWLRASWLEWLAIGFMFDAQADHLGLRIGKLLVEINGNPWLIGFHNQPPPGALPVPIQVVPNMPGGGGLMVGVDMSEPIGHYDARKKLIVVDHPERFTVVNFDDMTATKPEKE